ncbi:hypothetical protein BsWGS_23887 [Bradybaena similaris]
MSSYALSATPTQDHHNLHHVANGISNSNSSSIHQHNGFYYPFPSNFDKFQQAYQNANLLAYGNKPSFSVSHILDLKRGSSNSNFNDDEEEDDEEEDSDDNADSKGLLNLANSNGNITPTSSHNAMFSGGTDVASTIQHRHNLTHNLLHLHHSHNNNSSSNSSFQCQGSQSPREHSRLADRTPPSPRCGRTSEETPSMLINSGKLMIGVNALDSGSHDDNNNGEY